MTVPWGSGRRSVTCSPKRASSGAGCTRSPTSSTPSPSGSTARAKAALHEIYQAETRTDAEAGIDELRPHLRREVSQSGRQARPRIGTSLLTFYDYPAAHWVHLRTTNPIESTFATVRLANPGHQGCRELGGVAW